MIFIVTILYIKFSIIIIIVILFLSLYEWFSGRVILLVNKSLTSHIYNILIEFYWVKKKKVQQIIIENIPLSSFLYKEKVYTKQKLINFIKLKILINCLKKCTKFLINFFNFRLFLILLKYLLFFFSYLLNICLVWTYIYKYLSLLFLLLFMTFLLNIVNKVLSINCVIRVKYNHVFMKFNLF